MCGRCDVLVANKYTTLCPLLTTMCCYVAINCDFYTNFIINYKRYNSAYTGIAVFIPKLKS